MTKKKMKLKERERILDEDGTREKGIKEGENRKRERERD
jgi:hypothetical protein